MYSNKKKNQHNLDDWNFVVESVRSDVAERNIVLFPNGICTYIIPDLQELYLFPFSEPRGASGLATIFRNSPSGERESAWIVLQNMSYKEQGHIAKSREPSAALPLAAVPSPSTERRQPLSKRLRQSR